MANATVQQCRDILERQFDRTVGEVSADLLYDWLNDLQFILYQPLVSMDPAKYISRKTINVIAGTSEYALESDFKNMNAFGRGQTKITGIFYVDDDGNTTNRALKRTNEGSSRVGYWLNENDEIVLTPAPTTTDTLEQKYIPILARLSSLSDELIINREDITGILYWMVKNYGNWNIDISQESNNDARFAKRLVSLIKNARREPMVMTLN